jgi:long-chain acyl-CoA synthetase
MGHPKNKIGNLLVEVSPAETRPNGKTTSPEFRNVVAKDGFAKLEGVSTLYESFQNSVKKYPNNECLGWRPTDKDGNAGPFKWLTYAQTAAKVEDIASGLAHVGLKPQGRVGVFGANSPEWMTTMQACNRMSLYCVPLYDSLGENAIEFIISHSEASIVFAASDKLGNLAAALPHVLELVKTVVYWGDGDKVAAEAVAKLGGIKVYAFEEFLALGKAHPAPPVPPQAEDYCTIMYTSGTTGDPKGVLITHRAVVATVAATVAFLDQIAPNVGNGESVNQNDAILSYLPLAHIFDRAAEETFLYLGAKIGFWRGDIKGLVDDIGALKPTIFIGVPRVFDRIYSGVLSKIQEAGGLKACLFNWGFKRKLHFIEAGHPQHTAAPFFDKLVFSKIKLRLGGRVKLIVTGGAPLARHVEDFLKVTMCCPVVQGYGLTETCAASFIAVPDSQEQAGTVGPPMPCLGVRLESVPEMNYDATASPPRGEVCLRGPAVFSGYYKQEDKTKEVLDADGWFHTGDIGEITPAGALRITDRMKNIFKLSQGEYIAVEKVEAVFKKNSYVEQIWVYGNSYESQLVAVVVPSESKIQEWAKGAGVTATDLAGICKDAKTSDFLLKELNTTGKEGKLKGFELIKGVLVEPEQFSIEDDLMTPTFKLKRPQLQKKYQEEIDALYNKIRR